MLASDEASSSSETKKTIKRKVKRRVAPAGQASIENGSTPPSSPAQVPIASMLEDLDDDLSQPIILSLKDRDDEDYLVLDPLIAQDAAQSSSSSQPKSGRKLKLKSKKKRTTDSRLDDIEEVEATHEGVLKTALSSDDLFSIYSRPSGSSPSESSPSESTRSRRASSQESSYVTDASSKQEQPTTRSSNNEDVSGHAKKKQTSLKSSVSVNSKHCSFASTVDASAMPIGELTTTAVADVSSKAAVGTGKKVSTAADSAPVSRPRVTLGRTVTFTFSSDGEDEPERGQSSSSCQAKPGILSRISQVFSSNTGARASTKNSDDSSVKVGVAARVSGWFGRAKTDLNSSRRSKASAGEAMTSLPDLVEGRRRLGVQMHKVFHVGIHSLIISKGDITEFAGDAIVNAANESAVSGGGVSAAIAHAAGPRLNEELRALPEVKPLVRIRVGEATITDGYRLKASKIIHAVGPVYSSVKVQKNQRGVAEYYDWSWLDEKLKRAYKTSIGLAAEYECQRIGFALLSTGAFCGDRGLEQVLSMGAEALAESLREASSTERPFEVHMISNSDKVVKPLAKMCSMLQL